MKKVLIFIISATLMLSLCISSFASSAQYTYEFGNVSVIFDEHTPFSENSRERIAIMLTNEDDSDNTVETYGLACLFGHDYVEDNVITITHCVRDSQPRCLKEIFEISECSRCGKTKTERIYDSYIACCP